MAQFQARLIFLAFVCLCAGIASNALYFQDAGGPVKRKFTDRILQNPGKNPSASSKKRPVSKVSIPVAGGQAETTQSTGRSTGSNTALVKSIQRHLKSQDYFPGDVDGISGVWTRAAIMAFEHDNGLPIRGEPTDQVLKQIVLGPSAEDSGQRGGGGSSIEALKITKAVQKTLAELGYAPGSIDGMLGKETQEAIKNFEKDRKLPIKGRISGLLIKEIKKVAEFDLTL